MRAAFVTLLTRCCAYQSGWDPGCRRRPKAKYASGATPAVPGTRAAAHIHFEPRTWLAGRRLRSMTTAILRLASAIPATMINLLLRLLRSLHRRLAAMTSSTRMAGIADGLHLTSVRQPHYLAILPAGANMRRARSLARFRRASRVTRSALARDGNLPGEVFTSWPDLAERELIRGSPTG